MGMQNGKLSVPKRSSRGCRFMEKKFTVPMSEPISKSICDACGQDIKSVVYYARGKQLCNMCFAKM
jgi:hypothetical protein